MRAADVLDALLRRCRTLGVTILPGTPLRKLLIRDGKISGAESGRGRVDSPRLILACGGMGYPQLGGRGSGYELAREAGHRIVPPVPALVGLRAAEGWAARLPGIILPAATVRFEKNPAGTGELIFTHNGVSGPAVLDLSGSVARHLENAAEAVLACNWQSRPPEAYREQFALWQKQDGKKQMKTLLARMLPAAFADALCEAGGTAGRRQCRTSPGGAARPARRGAHELSAPDLRNRRLEQGDGDRRRRAAGGSRCENPLQPVLRRALLRR